MKKIINIIVFLMIITILGCSKQDSLPVLLQAKSADWKVNVEYKKEPSGSKYEETISIQYLGPTELEGDKVTLDIIYENGNSTTNTIDIESLKAKDLITLPTHSREVQSKKQAEKIRIKIKWGTNGTLNEEEHKPQFVSKFE